ncbi:MAG: hypothetical protein WAP55_02280 [Minisyncoccia bacterium]
MRTIFITSFNPFISRNILESDVLEAIKKTADCRIVIFCPDYKKDYFVKNFASENVLIEGIKDLPVRKQGIIFRYLSGSLLNTKTRFLHQKRKLSQDKDFFAYILSRFLAYFASKIPGVKSLARFLDHISINSVFFKPFFEKYEPDLVFCTDIFHNSDINLLAEAKKSGITVVGMVRSWDNITNKGLFRFTPDKLIVHNETIKSEVVKYQGMKSGNIFVGGMPQLDYYFNEPRISRLDFFKNIGFDPSCRLVFLGPLGKRFIETDWQILEILKNKSNEGSLPDDVRFLVRLPPNDKVELDYFLPSKRFFIYETGVSFKEGSFSDKEVTNKETIKLADSLFHSDLVVVYASSLIIDAVCFDKPVVCVSFDGFEKKDDLSSVGRFVKYYDHVKKMLKTNCCRVAENQDELVKNINLYLNNPQIDKDGRERFLREQAYKFDGSSGLRIGKFIVSMLPK